MEIRNYLLNFILKPLADLIIFLVSKFSYPGVIMAMAFQSACIPIPSEVILPFSGFMVSQGFFKFWLTVIAALLGCFLGATLAYSLGYFKGEGFVRRLIKKYGKYLLIFEYELDEAQETFQKYGEIIIFVSRLLPVVRTFIALPAGIAKMSYKKFIFFVLLGDFLWSSLLIYLGKVLGSNWSTLGNLFHKFDLVIVILGIGVVIWYVQHKLKKHSQRSKV